MNHYSFLQWRTVWNQAETYNTYVRREVNENTYKAGAAWGAVPHEWQLPRAGAAWVALSATFHSAWWVASTWSHNILEDRDDLVLFTYVLLHRFVRYNLATYYLLLKSVRRPHFQTGAKMKVQVFECATISYDNRVNLPGWMGRSIDVIHM